MGKPYVLVVEDSADLCQFYNLVLAQADLEVCCLTNGEEALASARERKPDIVLTDIMMPHLDGIELVKRFRQDAALAEVPILVLSAGSKKQLELASSAGATRVLAKPLDTTQLWTAVWSILPFQE